MVRLEARAPGPSGEVAQREGVVEHPVVARFIPGVEVGHLTSGRALRMKLGPFVGMTLIGSFGWSALLVFLGYSAGSVWQTALARSSPLLTEVFLIAVALASASRSVLRFQESVGSGQLSPTTHAVLRSLDEKSGDYDLGRRFDWSCLASQTYSDTLRWSLSPSAPYSYSEEHVDQEAPPQGAPECVTSGGACSMRVASST